MFDVWCILYLEFSVTIRSGVFDVLNVFWIWVSRVTIFIFFCNYFVVFDVVVVVLFYFKRYTVNEKHTFFIQL